MRTSRDRAKASQAGGPLVRGAPGPGALGSARAEVDARVVAAEAGEELGWRQKWARGYFSFIVHRVSSKDLAVWYRQFAYLLHAGMNLHQAADSVALKTRNRTLRRAAVEIGEAALRGEPPMPVFRRWPCAFLPFVPSLVEVGYETGIMDQTFERLAEFYDRIHRLELLWRIETFYPKLLILFPIFLPNVNAFVLNLVLTRCRLLSSVLTAIGFGSGPPTYLRVVVWLTLLVAVPVASLLLGWRALRLLPGFAGAVDRAKLRLPWFGAIARRTALARWARALAMLFQAGVPVTRAVRESGAASGNAAVEHSLARRAPMLDAGEPLSAVLEGSGPIPAQVSNMVASGERSGNVAGTLDLVAEYCEQEAETAHKQTAVATGVLFFLIVATIIGIIVVLFYLGLTGGLGARIDAGG